MHTKNYVLGLLCGLALAAVLRILLHIWAKKKLGQCSCDYDERQAAIRGRGFHLAYLTALTVLILGGLAELITGVQWCSLFTFAMIALWISICVFTTYCIVKDAYFTLRSKRRMLMIILLAAGAINIAVGILNAANGVSIAEDGILNLGFVNLLTGAGCLYLAAFMLAWTLHERRGEMEE